MAQSDAMAQGRSAASEDHQRIERRGNSAPASPNAIAEYSASSPRPEGNDPGSQGAGHHGAPSQAVVSSGNSDDLSVYGSWHFSTDDEQGGGFSVLSESSANNADAAKDVTDNTGIGTTASAVGRHKAVKQPESVESGKTASPSGASGDDDAAVLMEDEVASGTRVIVDAYGNRMALQPEASRLQNDSSGEKASKDVSANSAGEADAPGGTRITMGGETDYRSGISPDAEGDSGQPETSVSESAGKEVIFSGPCADIQNRIHRRRVWLETRRTEQFARGGAPNAETGIPDVTWQWCEEHPDDEECRMPPVTVFFTTEELQGGRLPEDYDRHIILMRRELAKCLHREKGIR